MLAAALALAASQAVPAAAGDPQGRDAIEQWRDTRSELATAEDDLTAVGSEVEQAQAELAAADAR
ncbi:MAG: hypothetical protein M3276_06390, partial [Actinomycetota bacterium]|nr:hypothetical protein [Actinomycetota bacterium]